MIVYVESEMAEDGFWSNLFGGPLSPDSMSWMWSAARRPTLDAERRGLRRLRRRGDDGGGAQRLRRRSDAKVKIRPSAGGAGARRSRSGWRLPEDLDVPRLAPIVVHAWTWRIARRWCR